MRHRSVTAPLALLVVAALTLPLQAGNLPRRAKGGMVISASDIASEAGWKVIRDGGNAVDAAVATAFALAVTHPTAGNIGGGGFIVFRGADGTATTFDFREVAPTGSTPTMWMKDGKYDFDTHHNTHKSVGVPGTVAGLYMAHQKLGSKPWKDLVAPAIAIVVKTISFRLRRLSRAQQQTMGSLTHVLEEAVKGSRVIKVYGGQQHEVARFHAQLACADASGTVASSLTKRAKRFESEHSATGYARAFAQALLVQGCNGAHALTSSTRQLLDELVTAPDQ